MTNKLLLAVFLFSFQAIASAAVTIGTVIFTADKVTAEQNHVKRTLARGAALFAGDIINTSDKSQAKIKYNNGTLVSIEPNTNYQVSSAEAKKDSAFDATLNNGTINYKSTGKKKQGTLNTPVVALAILGTETTVTYKDGVLEVTLTKGLIQIGAEGPLITAGKKAILDKTGKIVVSTTASKLRSKDTTASKVRSKDTTANNSGKSIPLDTLTIVTNNQTTLTVSNADLASATAATGAIISVTSCFPPP